MSTFTIEHDTKRYGDETGGLKHFGPRVVVSGVTADQAEAIAGAMSGCFDAGLTDQYEVQTTENDPSLAIAKYLDERMEAASVQFDITMHYVNEAVLAERERCAKIAEHHGDGFGGDGAAIAAKIRSGE